MTPHSVQKPCRCKNLFLSYRAQTMLLNHIQRHFAGTKLFLSYIYHPSCSENLSGAHSTLSPQLLIDFYIPSAFYLHSYAFLSSKNIHSSPKSTYPDNMAPTIRRSPQCRNNVQQPGPSHSCLQLPRASPRNALQKTEISQTEDFSQLELICAQIYF